MSEKSFWALIRKKLPLKMYRVENKVMNDKKVNSFFILKLVFNYFDCLIKFFLFKYVYKIYTIR